jgi:hypothetical protein
MHRVQFAKTAGAHFVAAWLAATAVACDEPQLIDYCPEKECHADGAADGPRRDTPLPPDAPAPDSGVSRSPLCGTTGCFPGNWNACGPVPLPVAPHSSFVERRAADDASDGSDDAVDTSTDAGTSVDAADAPGSNDAASDVCHDGSNDATQDVSVDIEPDATEDTTAEPTPDGTEDAQEEPDVSPPPTPDAGSVDGGARDVLTDIARPDVPRIVQSCYIRPGTTGVTTECAPVGPGLEGSACNDSRECGALMACVDVDGRPVCSTITCALPAACLKGTYYQEVPLRANGTTRSDLKVPACLLVDHCMLLAPNACPSGKACAVVGSEGDTTCLVPGTAKVGEDCDETTPCAEGLLCAKASNECVKICRLAADFDDCPTGTCQGGNRSLPDGFGICVGQRTDGG